MDGFDLLNNTNACPPERNALKEIYKSAKGSEWTDATNWVDEYVAHCSWFGVKCDATNTTTLELDLHNNGLSGKLSGRIADLPYLTKLDISDNDVKVCEDFCILSFSLLLIKDSPVITSRLENHSLQGYIPTEIGLLSNIWYLRLSYNSFIDNVPSELSNLHHLSLFHLHGNRIQGTMPPLDTQYMDDSSSFITGEGGGKMMFSILSLLNS